MKKLLSILSTAALLLLGWSCVKEPLATLDLGNSTPPAIEGYSITEDGLVINYTPAQLNTVLGGSAINQKMPVYNLVILSKAGNKEPGRVLSAQDDGKTLTVSNTTINRALIALGFKEGEKVDLEFMLRTSIQSSSYNNGVESFLDAAQTVSVKGFEIVVPQGNPWSEFTVASPWSLIGAIESTGNGWNKDEAAFMTPDGTRHVVTRIKLGTADQFKWRKDAGWDVNFGGPGDTEPYVITLGTPVEATPNGKNLSVPADGIYDVLLDESAGTITVTEAFLTYPGFDQVSNWTVIGAIASLEMEWNKDVQMTTDGTWHVAEGVVLTTADQFKFRQDLAWATNIGAAGDTEPFVVNIDEEYTGVANGKNLAVPADGTYDLLCNPATGAFKVVASLGGKSPLAGSDTPEPQGPAMFSLIGTINGGGWNTDIDMTNVEGSKWVARMVTVTADDEFKIRADHDWTVSFGGPEANSKSTINPEDPYDVYKPVIGTEFAAGDKNIQIGVAGIYDITLNYSEEGSTILIEEHVAAYSLIGEINGDSWTKDVIMTESDGIWTSPVVNITGGFKIRYDFSWDNCYGAESKEFVATPGTPFTAVQPGEDIKLAEAGDYKVIFNPATLEVTIQAVAFPDHLYMIGDEFGAWDWSSDGVVEMTPVVYQPSWGADSDKSEAQFFAIRYISAGKGFKFCSQKAWNGDFWGLDTNEGFTESGGNCTVDADGIYLIHIDLKRSIVHVEPARVYGIGNCFGGWDAAMEGALFKADGKTLKATAAADGELRMYVESSISNSGWWTREFIILDGKIDYRGDDEGQGDQARVNVKNGQEIILNFNEGTGEIKGEGEESPIPTTMYMIGDQFGGWNWDSDGVVELTPVWGTQGVFWCTRWFNHNQSFKFCAKRAWSGDFTGAGTVGYTVDGGNCWLAEDGFYTVLVDANDGSVEISPAEVYGIGDAWGNDAWDFNAADPVKFVAEGQKMVATVNNDSQALRIATKVVPSTTKDGVTPNGWYDWWKTEFIFFDGKIAYRGLGGDQARVACTAGQKVVLDFNAGTATLGDEAAPAAGITIDGDMSDWTGIEGASGEGINSVFKVTSDENNIYFYVKRTTERIADIWGGAAYHYYTFNMDGDETTGEELWGNGPYEMLLVVYPYAGSASAPEFGIAAAGTAVPTTCKVDNAVVKGVVTDSGVETEISIPRSDLLAMPERPVTVYSWSNKGGSDKLSVTRQL